MAKLAINGGPRERTTPFPSWPVWGPQEEEALLSVLKSGKWSSITGGKKTAEFEKAFAQYCGVKHAVTANNGTSTLMMALRAVGVGPGDEVIVPAYTFFATASAVLFCHAIPVFADIDYDTFCLDPGAVEAAITPRTRAIIPVHIGGRPADMDRLMEVARRRGLAVVEDCAQAHGARWKGRHVGSIGDIGSFSFQSSKNMTSAEGGIVTTDSDKVAELAWSYQNCGRVPGGAWYGHKNLGWNLRLTEFQAAILLAQLQRLDEQTAIRNRNGAYLDEHLGQIPGIEVMPRDERIDTHGYHLYIFRVNPDVLGVDRNLFIKALAAEGIPCSPGYVPLYKEPVFSDADGDAARFLRAIGRTDIAYRDVTLPNTERACAQGVWFSQSVLLGSEADMRSIVNAVAKVVENVSELRELQRTS